MFKLLWLKRKNVILLKMWVEFMKYSIICPYLNAIQQSYILRMCIYKLNMSNVDVSQLMVIEAQTTTWRP
jgi:hypothetical protein